MCSYIIPAILLLLYHVDANVNVDMNATVQGLTNVGRHHVLQIIIYSHTVKL